MKHKSLPLFLMCAVLLLNCSKFSFPAFPTATPTLTPTPTPRSIPAFETYSEVFPLDWPLEPLTPEQIEEARACKIEELAKERYLGQRDTAELRDLFEPKTACDWAALTYAYVELAGEDEPLPENAKNAFAKAIAKNLGFAFPTPLFYKFYIKSFTIVKPPPVSEQETTRVRISYVWSGMGDAVSYKVDIRDADTQPAIVVTDDDPPSAGNHAKKTVDKELVQALRGSLSNLLPIHHQFGLLACYDNYPEWTVKLTQKDGTVLTLKTNGSNALYIGGPWQTRIDGQDYVQFSYGFPEALDELLQEIGLPYGEPMAMTCSGPDVLKLAFP